VTRLLRALWLLSWILGLSSSALALPVTLTLVPSAGSLLPGQTLSVAVVVGGLTDMAGEIALESFDLDLSFDTTRLQFDSLSFATSLGDPNDGGETFVSGPGTPNVSGVVLMGEFSSLTGAQLLALQNAPFTLATIGFTALANPGPAEFEFINLDGSSLGGVEGRALGDELQDPNTGCAPPAVCALSVTIVPEPRGAALLAAALALLALRRRAARV